MQEKDVLDHLRADGSVKAAFRHKDKLVVVGIFETTSLAALQTQVQQLPFVSRGLMTFDFEEIIDL